MLGDVPRNSSTTPPANRPVQTYLRFSKSSIKFEFVFLRLKIVNARLSVKNLKSWLKERIQARQRGYQSNDEKRVLLKRLWSRFIKFQSTNNL